ncbi:hypothetical protein DZF91_04295 [Actinomadura logoneensis]|uniref:Uncharacterized protein n=1 Tax=Actinomadura logoneensis TaxID=2293572 RepID=A0A372JSY3_9ACTN|nr:hypothetical protein [Actinomadura logoneensis]RFU42874.1 hypothetical protein DZF91_04295 [Actinomadura logoneensis]
MRTLVPYPVLPGTVSVDVQEARLDGVALPRHVISKDNGTVALDRTDFGEWRQATFSVRLDAPQLEGDGRWSGVRCIAVLEERRTRIRVATPLLKSSPGIFEGTVALQRDHHVGRVRLTSQVVATVDDVPGRLIASARNPWTIDLTATDPTRKEAISTLWVDFGAEENPHLHPYQGDPWTIETTGEPPTVFLNTRFEGLREILHGGEKTVRSTLSAQIAVEAWISLLNTAAHGVAVESERPEWPGGWQETVLRRMLPRIFPDLSPDDALTELVARTRLDGGSGDLQARVLQAAGAQAKRSRRFGDFIRATSRKEGS